MRAPELRAMSVGEILDGAVALYRANFAALISIAIVCLGIPTVLRIYVAMSGDALSVLDFLGLLLWSFGSLVSSAATLWVVSESYLGRRAAVGQALNYAFSRIGSLFVAGLAVGVVVIFGLILFIVPGVIAACGYAVVSHVVVLERTNADTALKRSWQLTKGFRGKVFGLGCVTFLILLLPAMAFGMASSMLPGGEATGSVIGDFLSLVVTPLFTCAFTLLYYDLRVRKEAFDLEILNQQLTGSWPAAT